MAKRYGAPTQVGYHINYWNLRISTTEKRASYGPAGKRYGAPTQVGYHINYWNLRISTTEKRASYGPAGHHVIASVIRHVILPKINFTLYQETLNQTLNNLAEYRSQTLEEAAVPASENTQDKGDIQYLSKRAKSFWDSCWDLQWNAPELDLDTFCEVVVSAHITNLLIRQDLECTYDEADNTRMESIRYGDIYNGLGSSEEESDKFDNIFRDIVAEGKKVFLCLFLRFIANTAILV
ncbi:hypothetical protein CVT25_008467 [Psilocybe cyanescens]|uniref:Uncharacterized protein n=1 Tax=Psilocybe cyanescens TaxID=93625 RepID=A0A409X9Z6_PSICY|nr:hypothetical protein CVT25_008467 [Psilocybe cyanescens]